ncbi:hypothetical protein ID035_08640 [Pseudomonas aeruginosa]|nr:hypothetical protein [Pseudomonas aeruginosa]
MLESTRPLFDGWLRFFVGFIILNVILRRRWSFLRCW